MNTENLKIYESFDAFLTNHLFTKILKPNELKKNKKHRYHYSACKTVGPFIGSEHQNTHWIKWCNENQLEAKKVFDSRIMEQAKGKFKFNFYINDESVIINKQTSKIKKKTGNRANVVAVSRTDREQSVSGNTYIPAHQAGEKIPLR